LPPPVVVTPMGMIRIIYYYGKTLCWMLHPINKFVRQFYYTEIAIMKNRNDVLNNIESRIKKMISGKQKYIIIDYCQELQSELYDLCLNNDSEAFVKYEGEVCYSCEKCGAWQEDSPKSEYEEAAEILGYNPDSSPMLTYSDGYFYCESCGKRNFIDFDDIREYIEEKRAKYINYTMTNNIYIFNNNPEYLENLSDTYTTNQYDIYSAEIDIDNPSLTIHCNEMLVDLLFMDEHENLDICWKWIPLVVYKSQFNNN
jgi:hypothetical protein